MGLELLVDLLGESGAALAGGLLIGALFGAMAQRSRFCLRSATIELVEGGLGGRLAVWLLAFGAALAVTQGLVLAGLLDVSEARQLGGRASLSGAVLGGLLVGSGMILARGCPSRLLVLSANGNLRALLSGLVFTVIAQTSLRGALAPLRDGLAGLWTVDGPALTSLLVLLHLDRPAGLALGGGVLAAAVLVGLRSRLGPWGWIGGLGVGVAVGLGWLLTATLAGIAFEPVAIKSLSFSGPAADLLMLALAPAGRALDFDIGLVPGVVAGSFLAAVLARELRLEGFRDGPSMARHLAGAAMMGFGAMLAGGCAVGAGLSGGAVLALSAWLALLAMWVGAAATHLLLDREQPAGLGLAIAAR